MNNILDGAIREGLSLMGNPNLSEQQFDIWLEYSKNLLSLVSKNNASIISYYTIIYAESGENIKPHQKLKMCLRYLIGIQSII